MSVRAVRGTIGETATRIAGDAEIGSAHKRAVSAVLQASGAVQLGGPDVEWGEGFDLASGDVFTETRDVDNLYAVCESGTVAYQALLSGEVL